MWAIGGAPRTCQGGEEGGSPAGAGGEAAATSRRCARRGVESSRRVAGPSACGGQTGQSGEGGRSRATTAAAACRVPTACWPHARHAPCTRAASTARHGHLPGLCPWRPGSACAHVLAHRGWGAAAHGCWARHWLGRRSRHSRPASSLPSGSLPRCGLPRCGRCRRCGCHAPAPPPCPCYPCPWCCPHPCPAGAAAAATAAPPAAAAATAICAARHEAAHAGQAARAGVAPRTTCPAVCGAFGVAQSVCHGHARPPARVLPEG